jgi:hypothetical protein
MQKVEGSNPFSRFFALQIDALSICAALHFRVSPGTRISNRERISRRFRTPVPEMKPIAG